MGIPEKATVAMLNHQPMTLIGLLEHVQTAAQHHEKAIIAFALLDQHLAALDLFRAAAQFTQALDLMRLELGEKHWVEGSHCVHSLPAWTSRRADLPEKWSAWDSNPDPPRLHQALPRRRTMRTPSVQDYITLFEKVAVMKRCLIAVALSVACRAQPPTVVQSQGSSPEIQTCAGLGEEVWLGGTVGKEPDAFLTRLGPDGRSLWEKRFGGEGHDGVDALAVLSGGGAVVVGHCHSDLTQAWADHPTTDWERQSFVARVGPHGELLGVLDVRAAAGEAIEPYVKLQAVAAQDGQIWVGGRLEGSLWGLSSRGPQAFVAVLDPNLQLVKAQLLDGYEVTHLQSGLAAGVRKGDREQVVLWRVDSSGTSREIFGGNPSPSAACRQLETDYLVFEEESRIWQLELSDGKRQALPDQVWATIPWRGARWALGQASGSLAGTTTVGEGDVVLWRQQDSQWQPAWRFGTRRPDFFRFLVASPAWLTLAGRSRGSFPGQPEAPADEERATWIRLFRLPEGDDPATLGVRPAGATRTQLEQGFQDLSFHPRPGYDHFSGWLLSPEIGVTSREASPFDDWVCVRQNGDELARWGPAKNLPAPLEPQIFPLLSGNQVMCLSPGQGAEWFRLSTQGKIEAHQTLRRPQGLRVEQIAASAGDCLWVGREFTRKGQQRRVIGQLDQQGRESWSSLLQPWSATGAACLALARDGRRCALLLEDPEKCLVQALQLPSRQLFRLHEPGQPQTLAWVSGQLWLAGKMPNGLVLSAYDQAGKRIWRRQVPRSADFQVSQILATGRGAVLVGSRQDAVGAHGLVLEVDPHGSELWRWTPACDRDLLLKAARLDAAGQLWVGGEIVEDYETDVFWGRPKSAKAALTKGDISR